MYHIVGNLMHWLIYFIWVLLQSVVNLIADPGVVSSIPAGASTFLEIDHLIFSDLIHLFLLIQEGLWSVSSKSMCPEYWLTA